MIGSPSQRAGSPIFTSREEACNAFLSYRPIEQTYYPALPELPPLPHLDLTPMIVPQIPEEEAPISTANALPEGKTTATTKRPRKKRRTAAVPAGHYQCHFLGGEIAYVIPKGSVLVSEDLHTSLIRALVTARTN